MAVYALPKVKCRPHSGRLADGPARVWLRARSAASRAVSGRVPTTEEGSRHGGTPACRPSAVTTPTSPLARADRGLVVAGSRTSAESVDGWPGRTGGVGGHPPGLSSSRHVARVEWQFAQRLIVGTGGVPD